MYASSVGVGSGELGVMPKPRAPSAGEAKLRRPPAMPRRPREADAIGKMDRTVEVLNPRMNADSLIGEYDIFNVCHVKLNC